MWISIFVLRLKPKIYTVLNKMNFEIPVYTTNITSTDKDQFIMSSITDFNRDWFYDSTIKIRYRIIDLISDVIYKKMINDTVEKHKIFCINNLSILCDKYSINQQIGLILQYQQKNVKESFIYINLSEDEETVLKLNYICKYYNDFLKSIGDEKEIPKEFFVDLFNIEAPGQPVMGRGEFLLIFISPFPQKFDKKVADVILNEIIPVELKNTSAEAGKIGNGDKGNTFPLFNFLHEITGDKIVPQTISNGTKINENNSNILESINEIQKYDDEVLFNTLKRNIKDNFYFNKKSEKKKKNSKNNTDIEDIDIDKYNIVLRKAINELKVNYENKDFKRFIRISTSLYTVIYSQEENAMYFSYIDPNKNFHFLKVSDKLFDKIMMNDKFPFFQIRYSSGTNLINIKF